MRTVIEETQRASTAGGIVDDLSHHGAVLVEEKLVADTDLSCRLYQHVPQSQFLVQFSQQEHLNLCIGLFLGTIETGWEHLGVIQYHDIAIVEIVDDMAEGQETVGVVAFFVLLEHVDGLTLAVQHHQSTFITTINFLYRTVFVVEHAVGWLHGHLTLR